MKAYKISIILFVLMLIALNTGSAAARPMVDPVLPRCPTAYPYGYYYVDSSNNVSQQTVDARQYRYPYCKILPPGPIVWA